MHPGRWWPATVLLAIVLVSVSPSARSLELTSAIQLTERCRVSMEDWHGPDGQFCDAYLRGFVDGSPLVAIQGPRSSESFTQRAFRTRLGRPVSARPQYCIASETTMQDLVVQLLTQAREAPPRVDTDASVLIYSMLARYHPCT